MSITPTLNVALKNHLLAGLPAKELLQILPKLELVSFKIGDVIYETNQKIEWVYFPTTAIFSLISIMENGSTAEIGIIGYEGIGGIALYMGSEKTLNWWTVVQKNGEAFRMKAGDLQTEFKSNHIFQTRLLRFALALFTQSLQSAVCNALHSTEQRLCRWLLLCHDRVNSDKLEMTHELISNMLGIRRECVTRASQKLAEKELIANNRGIITIIDRNGLEAAVCECYRVVNNEYNRLLDISISKT